MEATSQYLDTLKTKHSKLTHINTTLYELIEAISDEVQPEEDKLVSETVLHLLNSNRIRYLDAAPAIKKKSDLSEKYLGPKH